METDYLEKRETTMSELTKVYIIMFFVVLFVICAIIQFKKTWKKIKTFYEGLNRYTVPSKIKYNELAEGRYFIFIEHTEAVIPSVSKRNKCNLSLCKGIKCKVTDLINQEIIELDEHVGEDSVRYYNIFSAYSLVSFWLKGKKGIEVEVWNVGSRIDTEIRIFVNTSLGGKYIFQFFFSFPSDVYSAFYYSSSNHIYMMH